MIRKIGGEYRQTLDLPLHPNCPVSSEPLQVLLLILGSKGIFKPFFIYFLYIWGRIFLHWPAATLKGHVEFQNYFFSATFYHHF